MNYAPSSIARRKLVVAGLSGLVMPQWSAAQNAPSAWPSRPLRIVVPYPAGGSPDAFARAIGEYFNTKTPTVPVVVENKPGASGLLGARAVAQAPADHHTLAYVSSGHITLAAMNPRFVLLKELRPVARLSSSPFAVLVGADSPHRTLSDLIRFVQANPGKVNCGTAGSGSAAHLAVEYLEESTRNFKTTLVPFKGAVESIHAILGGHIDMTIGVLGTAVPFIRSGKLRALAVTSPKRIPLLPDLPTVAESGGGSDYAFAAWGGFMVHAETPDDVVRRIWTSLSAATQSEGVMRVIANSGGMLDISESPEAFGTQISRDLAREQIIVKRLGMTME